MDGVDQIISQWRRERPDLNVEPMALIGRLMRLSKHLSTGMGATFAAHGLNSSSFDVLATLRRAGAPHQLSPGALMDAMMITSGTVTNRIDQLARRGLVERTVNNEDRRGFQIRLTEQGFKLIEQVIYEHVETQRQLVEGLSPDERAQFNELASTLLKVFESGGHD